MKPKILGNTHMYFLPLARTSQSWDPNTQFPLLLATTTAFASTLAVAVAISVIAIMEPRSGRVN